MECLVKERYFPWLMQEGYRQLRSPRQLRAFCRQMTMHFWTSWRSEISNTFGSRQAPQTGLVRDRCNVLKNDNSVVASIAATGFGLTALCIADKRNFIPAADARDRVLATLRFLWKKMPTHRGFFYHFADINAGERVWDSEVSSVDTAILLCGLLTCRRHFEGHSEISLLAFEIFNRVDWSWLSEDTSLLPHGWTPEFGFLPYRWDYYSEMMMIYLLGLGSLPHPLPADAWNAWKRTQV